MGYTFSSQKGFFSFSKAFLNGFILIGARKSAFKQNLLKMIFRCFLGLRP